MRLFTAAILSCVLVSITGCGAFGGRQETLVLPTVAELPTLTPSNTPTPTPTPTSTDTPTATATPTNTTTPTNTVTATPSTTPTFTITPSFTPSNTPVATNTPTNTPTELVSSTPAFPEVYFVQASVGTARPGDVVTISWSAESDQTLIEISTAQGVILQSIEVPPRGQQQFVFPQAPGATQIVYNVVATRSSQIVRRGVPINYEELVVCGTWFFDDALANGACSDGEASSSNGRYQSFEDGYMVYITARGIDRVIVLYDGRNDGEYTYESVEDGDVDEDPPDDRERPQDEFEGIWENDNPPGDNDNWEDEIGWARNDADTLTVTIQDERDSDRYYIGAGGRVWRLDPDGDNPFDDGRWVRLDN